MRARADLCTGYLYKASAWAPKKHWSNIGASRDNGKIETTIEYWVILGNGKENGNYYSILGLYWDNGQDNGKYDRILGLYWPSVNQNGNSYSILGLYYSILAQPKP